MVVPASLVGYIEILSSGTLNLTKTLKQHQLEAVSVTYVHQDLTIISNGVIVLKQKIGNNIQGYFPDLLSYMNDTENELYQKTFGIISLNNVVDNLNITDLQQKITEG